MVDSGNRISDYGSRIIRIIRKICEKVYYKGNTSYTFFAKSPTSLKTEVQSKGRVCKLCGRPHGIWACGEFQKMEVLKRWESAKKFKLWFRCFCQGQQGQSCFQTRVCGLEGCQEVHHRLLHLPALIMFQ